MSEKTYLITGSMGCIGAWTLYHLVKNGERAVSFDLSEDRSRLDLLLTPEEQTAITFIKGDLTNYDQVAGTITDENITHIVHLAALQVPFCRANPVMGAKVNVTGTVNIFEAAKQAGLKHLAYASSIAVYGAASAYPPGPIAHDAPHLPGTLYGVYKVANEGTAKVYWQDHQLSSMALRPYTVYGIGRDQGLTSDPTKSMLAAAKGEPSQINFGGLMQFQLASDVALQFIDAATIPMDGAHVFNLGTPPVTIDEVIALIKAVKPDAEITRTETILPFPEVFDDSALRAAVPTVYETPLAEGIAQTIAHFERVYSL
ncbi:MAG: NAD(P)-dependent oxidoreductase [Aggregatilineales bacterium]